MTNVVAIARAAPASPCAGLDRQRERVGPEQEDPDHERGTVGAPRLEVERGDSLDVAERARDPTVARDPRRDPTLDRVGVRLAGLRAPRVEVRDLRARDREDEPARGAVGGDQAGPRSASTRRRA